MEKINDRAKAFEKIKVLLLERKKELEDAIENLKAGQDQGDQVQDPGEQALAAAFESLKSSLHNNEYEEYKMIVKALEMIKAGTYGDCANCQQPISEKRLQLYPNATRCLACQEKIEDEELKNKTTSYF